MFLFFSVARSQQNGSWERATETAQQDNQSIIAKAPPKPAVSKSGVNPNFGMNLPMMSSAFDTAAWLNAA